MKRTTWWAGGAVLVLTTLASYAGVLHNGFVWDDAPNIVHNRRLDSLDWELLRWSFSSFGLGHYQPLTWLSLALDRAMWGADPAGFHVTNVVLHALNALLVALLARRILSEAAAGAPSSASWVDLGALLSAGFFALHPMRVESVAWATERRDMLSGMFCLLSVTAFLRYVRAPDGRRRRWYLASLALFALSLLSKALALTLPVVLLVLDAYPLRRFAPAGGAAQLWRLVREKLPFLALSLGFGVTALAAQRAALALTTVERYDFGQRLAQMAYSAIFYPRMVFATAWYPLYERPSNLDPLEARFVVSGLAVVALTLSLWMLRRRLPAGLTAWLCYLILLVPVSGLAQSGIQLVADRYSYLAGLAWALLLGAGAALAWFRGTGALLPIGALFVALVSIGSWTVLSSQQTRVWRDDTTVWRKVLRRGPSAMAYNNLGVMALERGDTAGALILFGRALSTAPTYGRAWSNILTCLERGGATIDRDTFARVVQTLAAALPHHQAAATAWYTLGLAHATLGNREEAVAHLHRAVAIDPHHAKALATLERLGDRPGSDP